MNTISLPYNACNVPASVNGPVAIWVTTDVTPMAGNVVDRDASKFLVAGPALAFIDIKPEALGALVRTSSSGSSNGTATTEDISPSEASGVASSGNSSDSSSGGSSGGSAGPNLSTGSSSDGLMDVVGWTNLPPA